MPSSFRYVLCDVFTDRPLTGNPLAVFTDARGLADETMQAIAREMNLSESVFVFPATAGGHARLRIFTPRIEIPFAGHPTLGSAFVLGGPMQLEVIRLETAASIVPVRLEREGARVAFGWMQQPLCRWRPVADEAAFLTAVGLPRARVPIVEYDNGPKHVVIVAETAAEVAALRPDLARIASLASVGVSVCASIDDALRWKTRMFAPGAGVNEDPATGSAAGPIAVHLARHGLTPFGQVLHIEQGAEILRPSHLHAVAHGSGDNIERIEVGGAAIIIGRGELRLSDAAT